MTDARASQRGFTFIGVLLLVAIMGMALAAAGELWSTAAKRDKEAELLFIGDQYRAAIGQYFESSPGAKVYPRALDELLEDRRFPFMRRYLRREYIDPVTGSREWGLVMRGDRIAGVYSKSKDAPLKRANFPRGDEGFEAASAYSDWKFVYGPAVPDAPRALAVPPVGAATAPATVSPAEADRQAFRRRQAAQVARPSWVCSATRANDLRNCERARNFGDGGVALEACQRAAAEDYRICMATALRAATP